jgi:hypothetical protein
VRRWTLIFFAAAFLVPLVPAVALYELFTSQNSATYDNAGLKLGGPVAAYFALLLLALRYIDKWRTASDPLEHLKKDLVGAWDIKSTSKGTSGRVADSIATFTMEDDKLRLSGGSITEQEEVIGSWTPDPPILDPDRDGVVYLYELTDVEAVVTWRGLMKVTFDRTKSPLCMSGTWEVIGPDYHRGTVTFKKRPSS